MVTPSERQELLAELNTLAVRDLVGVWRRALIADVDFAKFILDAFPQIATSYANVSADLAVEWYQESVRDGSAYRAKAAPPPPTVQLQESAVWALGSQGDAALARLTGTMQRAVFSAARDTIADNATAEPGVRWARHASANACAFCRMMAIRSLDGTFYGSEAHAQRRGKNQVEDKYHDHCHCMPVEIRRGATYRPPAYVEDWNEQYKTARKDAESGDSLKILAAWRQLDDHVH